MISLKYISYNLGNPTFSCHIDAVHAASPDADLYTGKIAQSVINSIDASGIIGIISRREMDINRPRSKENAPAIDEFRGVVRLILDSKKIIGENGLLLRNYLHLAIHGMNDDRKIDFAVGTRRGDSCSPEILNWFVGALKQLSNNVTVNTILQGDQSKSFHRHGDPDTGYTGYGEKFNTIQLEISREWRKNGQKQLVLFFADIISQFDKHSNNE
jgi:hypothetical protein